MRSVPRCAGALLVVLLFALPQPSSGQPMRGRMRVLVPTFAVEDGAASRVGQRLAETVRRHIDDMSTHVSVDPREVRDALRKADRREEDMDCVRWRQLGYVIKADLVLCGSVTAAGQVAATFASPTGDATFAVPPFALESEEAAARQVVTAFGQFIDQIAKAYYCAEAIGNESWKQALTQCTAAVESNPTMVGAQYHLASALIRLDRVEEALAAYERVIALDPMHQDALLGAGVAASRLGQTELSKRRLDEYLTLNPGDEQVRISVASRLATEGDPLAALQLTEAALQRPDAGAMTYRYAGHFAIAAALRVQERQPAGADQDQAMRRLLETALAHYAAAAERGAAPDETTARSTMQALVRLGRAAEAVTVGEQAIERFPADVSVWSLYADALREMKRPRDALAALDRVAELAPDQPRIGARRALLLIELGRPRDAVAAARQSIDRGEIDAASIESIAQTFVGFVTRMNPLQHEQAVSYLDAARQLGKSERTIGMINHVHGYVLYRRGEQLAKPATRASAAEALPVFQMALNLLQSATGYTDQVENRRAMIKAVQQYIEIQQALMRR